MVGGYEMKNRYYLITIACLIVLLITISTVSISAENNRREVYSSVIERHLNDINNGIYKLKKAKMLFELSDDEIVDFYKEIVLMTEIKESCISLTHHIQLKGKAPVTELEIEVGDYFGAIVSYILDVTNEEMTKDHIMKSTDQILDFTSVIEKSLTEDFSNDEDLYQYIVNGANGLVDKKPGNALVLEFNKVRSRFNIN